jgi:hypothetical protein
MTANENSFSGIGGASGSQPQSAPQLPKSLNYNAKTNEVLVWQKSTWGNFGQHSNIYTFVIAPDLKIKPIWEAVTQVRHENNDSRKNAHRFTYAQLSDVLKLEGHILKVVYDYASSSKREVSARYFLVIQGKIIELESESGFKDANGFFDIVELPDGRKLKVYKDKVELG